MSIDLSLSRIKKLFSLLPAYTRPTIHIAGTNGKGSVTAILSSILTSSSISVGRFNSPHLLYVWDAISLNGNTVSQDTYHTVRNNVEGVNRDHAVQATSFEVMTATAAQIFEQAAVDIAIFEVGLGGRLDATNALPDECILVSAITSVALDHQQFLGTTPAAIAREKAGIARPAKSCILGAQTYPEVDQVVQHAVQSVGGNLVKAVEVTLRHDLPSPPHSTRDTLQFVRSPFPAWDSTLELELPLLGAHQLQNLATALTILSVIIAERSNALPAAILNRITPSTLDTGVRNTKWPGRLEHVRLLDPPLTLLVDGAHNPASAAALATYLTSTCNANPISGRTFILGLSHSPPKTPFDTLSPLLRPGDRVALVPFSDVDGMPWVKNAPLTEVEEAVRRLIRDGEVRSFDREPDGDVLRPLKLALAWAAGGGDRVVLAGSLYLVADLHRILVQQR